MPVVLRLADCFGFGGAVAGDFVKATDDAAKLTPLMGCEREYVPAASCERVTA